MAKRKGKSQHRLNWQQQYEHGADDRQQFSSRSRLTQRAIKLPADRLAADTVNTEDLPKTEGMIVGMMPGGAIVLADGGELICGIAKAFRPPEDGEFSTALTVGDNVTLALARGDHTGLATATDKERCDGWIVQRQLRRTALSRPGPRSAKRRDIYDTETFEKVIVANMDILLVVASTCQPPLRQGLIDRFLIIAERGELAPVLVVNKIDIVAADENLLADFRNLGMAVHCVSAASGQGVDTLANTLAGRRSVLAGPSGVGKSTLVNALVPGAAAVTRTVRTKDERGRHTTTSADIYPMGEGGLLVDTPGVRELGVSLTAAALPWYFPEFEPFSGLCKFRDCTHTHEPNCAVQRAVEDGQILPRRFESYLRILDTLAE